MKFTDQELRDENILNDYISGLYSAKELSMKYELSKARIYDILRENKNIIEEKKSKKIVDNGGGYKSFKMTNDSLADIEYIKERLAMRPSDIVCRALKTLRYHIDHLYPKKINLE